MTDRFTPSQLSYSDTFPAKIPCTIKHLRLTPIALPQQNGGYKVTIPIKNDKFWDPYSAYLKITVDFSSNTFGTTTNNPLGSDGTTLNEKCWQLDGHISSIIAALSFTNDNDDIEAIFYHDVICNLLKDVGASQIDKYSRMYEGIGSISSNGMPMQFSAPMAGAASAISSAPWRKENAGGTVIKDPVMWAAPLPQVTLATYETALTNVFSFSLQQNFFSGYGYVNINSTSIFKGISNLYAGYQENGNATIPAQQGVAVAAIAVGNQLSKLFNKTCTSEGFPTVNVGWAVDAGLTEGNLVGLTSWNAKFVNPNANSANPILDGSIRQFDNSLWAASDIATGAQANLILPQVPIQKAYFNPTRIQHIYYKYNDLTNFDNQGRKALLGAYGFGTHNTQVGLANPNAGAIPPLFETPGTSGIVIDDNWCQGPFLPNYVTVNMVKANSCTAPQRFSWNVSNPSAMVDGGSFNNFEFWPQYAANGTYTINPTDMWQMVEDYGFSDPFPASTSVGCFETIFSAQLPQRLMVGGIPKVTYQLSYTYIMPLMSGVFGVLMPPDKHKLIPMAGFRNLVMNAQINPYAFFTSWQDTNQAARIPQITKFELHADVADFHDDTITEALNETLQAGIVIHTESWYNCLYSTFNQLPSEIKINQGFVSLKSLVLLFNATDYRFTTAARKYYRLSQNITSFQIQIGTTMFPQNAPISGNAGCNTGALNNTEFIYNLLKIWGLHLAPRPTMINPVNYSIDFRDYDYTMAINAMTNSNPYDLNHPQWQLSYFKENRIVGKAAFGYDFDSMGYDTRMIAGINTYEAKPFSIWLTQDSGGSNYSTNSNTQYVGSTNAFQIEAYAFGLYDLIVRIGPQSAKTQGV